MGVVYEANDTLLSRSVAVKLILAHDDLSLDAIARLELEAKATARLGHPNIVRILDLGRTEDRGAYLVMEKLEGETLQERLERTGKIEPERAVKIHLQLLDALAAAHSDGVLHRDIKPSNIFLTPLADGSDFVKLLDFGLAYLLEEKASPKLTATGIALGTPAFMSPERVAGEGFDERSDLYSVGVSLYQTISGELPFRASTPIALRGRILLYEAPSLRDSNPGLDADLASVVAKSLAKKRPDRFADATAMREALARAVGIRTSHASQAPATPTVSEDAETRAFVAGGTTEPGMGPAGPADEDEDPALGNTLMAGGITPPPSVPAEKSGTTLRGHGGAAPEPHPTNPNAEPEAAGTLALGGITRPPPTRTPSSPVVLGMQAPPPRRATRPWLAGVGVGVGIGLVLLTGLFLGRLMNREPAPTPQPPAPASAPPPEPPAPEVEAPSEPPPAPVPEPLPSLPTRSETEEPPPPTPRPPPRRRGPRVRPTPPPPVRPPPPPRVGVDEPLEPDWGSAPR